MMCNECRRGTRAAAVFLVMFLCVCLGGIATWVLGTPQRGRARIPAANSTATVRIWPSRDLHQVKLIPRRLYSQPIPRLVH